MFSRYLAPYITTVYCQSLHNQYHFCGTCGKATGFVCTSTIYAVKKVDFICPWCVADGTAAKKFNGSFIDDYPLIEAGIVIKLFSP
ncbi:hypothetical protein FOB89_19535 [Shewanella putrefaciens]|nr:hypothetical protein FOB89_19535 [Shewanella putrefaciens]